MSCASCHSPANHYAPVNGLAIQLGGRALDRPGVRAVPSLAYADQVPDFNVALANPDGSASGPGGGLDWDGRAASLSAQSVLPLVSDFEMANPSMEAVVARIAGRPAYASALRAAFGPGVFDVTARAEAAIGASFEAYIREDRSFHPYSSKYDAFTRGLATLTAQEQRGMTLFNDADRANCASCHTAGEGPGRHGEVSSGQFTDYFLRNIGAPPARNAAADEGLCGPLRTDLTPRKDPRNSAYCGLFMTSGLRNVSTRHVFFHDGSIHSLRDAVEFYNTRDTDPDRWYRDAPLPEAVAANVDHTDMPFANQQRGGTPLLSKQDIDDLLAFLQTLTDGYVQTRSR